MVTRRGLSGRRQPVSRPAARPTAAAVSPQFQSGDRGESRPLRPGDRAQAELTADDEEVTVAFAGKGTKTLLASFAKLRKVDNPVKWQRVTPR